MKTLLKTVSAAALAALSVSAFAAPEEHEEFARQYTPESQAVFERFRKDHAEAEKLRASLDEDLRVMNRPRYDDAGWWALSRKISALEARESEWAAFIQDAFLRHTAGLTDAEKLGSADAELAKKTVAWENGALKDLLKNSVAVFGSLGVPFGVPAVVKIPGRKTYAFGIRQTDKRKEVVKVPYAFGVFEVTQAQYQAVTGKNPSRLKGSSLPVTNVSWDDAREFCEKLTERERAAGRISENQEYRLPTWREWTHACRAGTTTKFYTGDSEEDLARAAWYEGNSGGRPHPVGLKEPNAFGLYDMHGNVGEWLDGEKGRSVYALGGIYFSSAEDELERCQAPYGPYSNPYTRLSVERAIGFRVVLTNVQ